MNRQQDSTRVASAAEHLHRVGLYTERADHAWLANLCWMKRVEALNTLGVSVAQAARRQHARFDRTDARSIW